MIAASKDCLGSLQIQELLTLVEEAYGFAPTAGLHTLTMIMLLAEGDYVGAEEVLDKIKVSEKIMKPLYIKKNINLLTLHLCVFAPF